MIIKKLNKLYFWRANKKKKGANCEEPFPLLLFWEEMFTVCLQVLTLLRDLCTLLFFFYPSLWKTLKAEMNLWVSGVGLTWAKFVSPGASHKCHRTVLKVKIYLPFCFWMWDPLMGLWRNLGWNEAVTSCSPWSDIAESMIVQLPFHHMKSVCHFSWDSLRDWFTRLSNVIQHQVHRLSCQKFKFWSLFSPLTNSL